MSMLNIAGMWGLGDNIYQRPFIRAAARRHIVYLDTPWPELYSDIPALRFVRNRQREGRLRTQTKNMRAQPVGRYSDPPIGARMIRLGYGHHQLANGGIVKALEAPLPLCGDPFVFDLPKFELPSSIVETKPIALVRPVTVRSEWRNEARNPLPEYVNAAAARLMDSHHVVSIADLKPGEEWLIGDSPRCHVRAHAGEFNVAGLLGLLRHADIVVGGVGWIVPASIAARVRCFVILGGHGAHNNPAAITDRRMILDRITFATPDRFCGCANMQHKCDKRISNFESVFDRFLIGKEKTCTAS